MCVEKWVEIDPLLRPDRGFGGALLHIKYKVFTPRSMGPGISLGPCHGNILFSISPLPLLLTGEWGEPPTASNLVIDVAVEFEI